MKDFVFIIPLTPLKASNPFRQELFQLMLKSLNKQSSDNWQAILVGEFDKTEGNFIYIPAKALEPGYVIKQRSLPSATDKHFKIDVALQYISNQPVKPKYLIRLDDDDIFSPTFLSSIKGKEFDCFADKFHTYYDVHSGRICQNAVPWLPNTIIHKYEHAITILPGGKTLDEPTGALISWSHNIAFHEYYKDKNIFYAGKEHPIYLRTITPSSVSFTQQQDKVKYQEYMARYGDWYYRQVPEYEPYISELGVLAEKHFGNKIKRDFGVFQALKDNINNHFLRYRNIVRARLKA